MKPREVPPPYHCQWCGKLALTKVEVSPPVIRKVPQQAPIIVKPAIEAWACATHTQMVEWETLRAERDKLKLKKRRTAADNARLAELESEAAT
jgi:hypothetical protein